MIHPGAGRAGLLMQKDKSCTVSWKAKESVYICPCHDAKFSADGKVLAEPAKSPLPAYEVKEQDGKIFVQVV